MLFNSVIIVLREVLEASLLVSILLSISKIMGLSLKWFWLALSLGLIGAVSYALSMGSVSTMFDYTGQEIFNGVIQIVIFLSTLLLVFILNHRRIYRSSLHRLSLLLIFIVSMAMVREGAEVFIYLNGFVNRENFLMVMIGAFIGFAIGISVGVIIFYFLTMLVKEKTLISSQIVLAVVVTGLLGQVIPIFEQIDVVPMSDVLWDMTGLLSEESIVGQLLYAVAGYEATPSLYHVLTWLIGFLSFLGVIFLGKREVHEAQ